MIGRRKFLEALGLGCLTVPLLDRFGDPKAGQAPEPEPEHDEDPIVPTELPVMYFDTATSGTTQLTTAEVTFMNGQGEWVTIPAKNVTLIGDP